MKDPYTHSSTRILFLTDLHMDRMCEAQLHALDKRIRITDFDHMIVTGDISNATDLHKHLSWIAQVAAPRPVHYVTGNHEYYGSSFRDVENTIEGI